MATARKEYTRRMSVSVVTQLSALLSITRTHVAHMGSRETLKNVHATLRRYDIA